MPVYNRNAEKPDLQPNWWLDYYVSEDIRARFKLKSIRIREPSGLRQLTAANRLLGQREKQVRDVAWTPWGGAMSTTVAEWAERWIAQRYTDGVKTARDYETRLRRYVLPALGSRPLAAVSVAEVRSLVADLRAQGKLSARSIHHVYEALRGMYDAALRHEPALAASNPCMLSSRRAGELPEKRDADPRWRLGAMWRRHEIEAVLASARDEVPLDRLVFYATYLLTGARVGEVCGLQVRDFDASARPLARLVFAEQAHGRELKGAGPVREVPVHPELGKLLDEWLAGGCASMLGRRPLPTDPLIPSRLGKPRSKRHMLRKLGTDLGRLGLPKRTQHDARRTLASLMQEDGADDKLVQAITHEGRASSTNGVFRGYTIWSWEALCGAMACLNIAPRRTGHTTGHSRFAEGGFVAESSKKTGGVDGARTRTPVGRSAAKAGILGDSLESRVAQRAAKKRPGDKPVTPAVTDGGPPDLARDLRAAADALLSGASLTGEWRERLAAACKAAASALEPGTSLAVAP